MIPPTPVRGFEAPILIAVVAMLPTMLGEDRIITVVANLK